jgi:serine phosphatase RsbU (regulator of sigma subunit)
MKEDKMAADESDLGDIFQLLDTAVMERLGDGSLQLIGDLPECLKRFFPHVIPGKRGFAPEAEFPFLENFLIDAEIWWTGEGEGKLKSGPWIETDSWGNECEFEATAISLGKRKILLIELARYSYEEKQSFIQKSRELGLAYHRLAQTEAELQKSKALAEEANRKILSSIRYAKMIQQSLLPNPENIRCVFPDSFVIWMPRDIVGGDFIFSAHVKGKFVIAVIDCTGHGVPGAFITIVASFALRKIIEDEQEHDPATILKRLNGTIKTTLQQDTAYALSDDGLDAAVVSVDLGSDGNSSAPELSAASDRCFLLTDDSSLIFAGAKLPLFYICDDELKVVKGDRRSVGYRKSDVSYNFTNHKISVRNGMFFYLSTDGFTDQLGEKNDRRFGTRRLTELLKENVLLPFEKQREQLLRVFEEHKGRNETQDDVTVVGFGF